MLKGEHVYLAYEGDTPAKDKYGRALAYVYRAPDGLLVNAEIIRQGYGHAYVKFPFKCLDEFRQLERFARQAKKGLWAPREKAAAPAKAPVVFGHSTFVKPGTTSDPERATAYVTRTGVKYHMAGCQYLRRGKTLIKLKEAKAKGYGPCSRCWSAR